MDFSKAERQQGFYFLKEFSAFLSLKKHFLGLLVSGFQEILTGLKLNQEQCQEVSNSFTKQESFIFEDYN